MNQLIGSGVSYWSPIKISSELLWRKLAEVAEQYAKGDLIDIGCGAKPYESLFLPYISRYFGVDWQTTSDVHYGDATKADLFADCTDTKLAGESFDTLLSTQVMEHIYDTHAYLAECKRLLKTNGVGIFTIPFVWETHAEPFDYYRFTSYSLEKLFTQHGFRVEKIEQLGGAHATLTQMKIVSLYCRALKNLPYRIIRKLKNLMMIPIQNFMSPYLDRLFWNDKLCLNYVVIVQKLN